MRRSSVLVLAAVVVFGLTATGAVDTLPAPAENVELSPTDGANGEYASLTASDELRVNAERLNDDARTRIGTVFRLTYTGNGSTDVWITDESSAVTFTAFASSIEGTGNAITLETGESVAVGVVVDTREAVPSTADFTVNARVPDDNGDTTVRIAESTPGVVDATAEDVAPNDPVTVDVRATNAVNGVRFESVTITTTRTTALSVNVSTNESSSPVPPMGADEMAYVNVTHETPESDIAGTSFVFTVDRSTLDAAGVAPENVQLYRYVDGEWVGVTTSVVGETAGGDAVRFRADAPGLSTFAVAPASDEPSGSGVDDTDPTDDTDSVDGTNGADDTDSADDTNSADDADGADDTDRTDDGTPTTTATSTATATTTATPTSTPDDGAATTATPTPDDGEPAVTATATATPADERPTTTATTPAGELFGFPTGQVAVLVALVAAVIGVGVYRARSGD